MARVALSGASGNVGQVLRPALLARGIALRSAGGTRPLTPVAPGEEVMHGDLRDPAVVDRLCVQEGRTETEIAVLLSISRPRVATVLRNAGTPGGTPCPVDPDTLVAMVVQAGVTVSPRWPGITRCPMRRRHDGSPRLACLAPILRSIRGSSASYM